MRPTYVSNVNFTFPASDAEKFAGRYDPVDMRHAVHRHSEPYGRAILFKLQIRAGALNQRFYQASDNLRIVVFGDKLDNYVIPNSWRLSWVDEKRITRPIARLHR